MSSGHIVLVIILLSRLQHSPKCANLSQFSQVNWSDLIKHSLSLSLADIQSHSQWQTIQVPLHLCTCKRSRKYLSQQCELGNRLNPIFSPEGVRFNIVNKAHWTWGRSMCFIIRGGVIIFLFLLQNQWKSFPTYCRLLRNMSPRVPGYLLNNKYNKETTTTTATIGFRAQHSSIGKQLKSLISFNWQQ